MKLLNDAKINERTRANLTEVERLAGVTLTVIKGQKINPGDSSAGTHDGYGVVDLRTAGWSTATRWSVLTALRETGNAAWYRTVAQGFDGPHIHAVLMGEPDLSPAARRQVTAYRTGHNGLANNGPDDGPEGFTGVLWESYLKAHPLEDDVTPQQVDVVVKTYALWSRVNELDTQIAVAAKKGDKATAEALAPFRADIYADWQAASRRLSALL